MKTYFILSVVGFCVGLNAQAQEVRFVGVAEVTEYRTRELGENENFGFFDQRIVDADTVDILEGKMRGMSGKGAFVRTGLYAATDLTPSRLEAHGRLRGLVISHAPTDVASTQVDGWELRLYHDDRLVFARTQLPADAISVNDRNRLELREDLAQIVLANVRKRYELKAMITPMHWEPVERPRPARLDTGLMRGEFTMTHHWERAEEHFVLNKKRTRNLLRLPERSLLKTCADFLFYR